MPTLNITEFPYKSTNANNTALSAATAPFVAVQNVTIGAGSLQSAAFNDATSLIRLSADTTCAIEISATPTATALKMRISANQPEFIGVPAGAAFKVAVIAAT